jgi:Zn-dependent protease
MEFVILIAILIMSIVIHELAHGYSALALGDPTAKYAGRLTLNPIRHLDVVGSFIVPFISYALGGFIFGWAKPVPYNPFNLKNQRWGELMVAVAGPLSNILLAFVFGILVRASDFLGLASDAFLSLAVFIVFINVILAIFNLVPIPPLDGSKILFAFLPYRYGRLRAILEAYGLILVILFIFFFLHLIFPIVMFLSSAFTGFSGPELIGILSGLLGRG